MSGPRLVVKKQKSKMWYGLWALALVMVIVSAYLIGRYLAVAELEFREQQVDSLQQRLSQADARISELSARLVMQEQSSQVDNQSREQLLQTVKQLQAEQSQLQEELDFYRRIMAPEKKQKGLTIADFAILSASGEHQYDFKLALAQTGKQDQFLKGKVSISVNGELNGVEKQYPIRELGTFTNKQFEFQFRYFQNMEGKFSLPPGFVPASISIEAKTRGLRKNQSVSRQFPWALQE